MPLTVECVPLVEAAGIAAVSDAKMQAKTKIFDSILQNKHRPGTLVIWSSFNLQKSVYSEVVQAVWRFSTENLSIDTCMESD